MLSIGWIAGRTPLSLSTVARISSRSGAAQSSALILTAGSDMLGFFLALNPSVAKSVGRGARYCFQDTAFLPSAASAVYSRHFV
jgi:hypothetical protein